MLDKPDSIAEFFNAKIKLLPYSLFTEKRDFQIKSDNSNVHFPLLVVEKKIESPISVYHIIDMMECRRFQMLISNQLASITYSFFVKILRYLNIRDEYLGKKNFTKWNTGSVFFDTVYLSPE
ncbi:hypothetical protein T08_3762 [Trichinella sp. T8]|nr:hypothetical protein T08_3762 [Trichinella sp. T8]